MTKLRRYDIIAEQLRKLLFMEDFSMSTYMAKKETVERKWYIIDAANKPLGRTASELRALRAFAPIAEQSTVSRHRSPFRTKLDFELLRKEVI